MNEKASPTMADVAREAGVAQETLSSAEPADSSWSLIALHLPSQDSRGEVQDTAGPRTDMR